jgi:hypothetical protein
LAGRGLGGGDLLLRAVRLGLERGDLALHLLDPGEARLLLALLAILRLLLRVELA